MNASTSCDPGGAQRALPDGRCVRWQLADQSEWIDGRDYYAEMHAYSLAAAMAGVRHRGSNTTMHQTLRLAEQGTGALHVCLQKLHPFILYLIFWKLQSLAWAQGEQVGICDAARSTHWHCRLPSTLCSACTLTGRTRSAPERRSGILSCRPQGSRMFILAEYWLVPASQTLRWCTIAGRCAWRARTGCLTSARTTASWRPRAPTAAAAPACCRSHLTQRRSARRRGPCIQTKTPDNRPSAQILGSLRALRADHPSACPARIAGPACMAPSRAGWWGCPACHLTPCSSLGLLLLGMLHPALDVGMLAACCRGTALKGRVCRAA